MKSLAEYIGLDKAGDQTAKDALGSMTVTDMLANLEGFVNFLEDKATDTLKPTQDRINKFLDNVNGLVTDLRQKGIKALL